MSAALVYITAPNVDEAQKLGHILVSKRLAACVNILPGMESMYWWDGAVQTDNEAVLIAKTRGDLAEALTKEVLATHEYDVPCVVTVPITGGNPAFLAWIEDETAAPDIS